MPNYCWNSVTFSHEDKTKMDEMNELLSKEDAEFFNHYVPLPKEEEDNWYSWRIENWGTKWDAGLDSHDYDGDFISVAMQTAWSPPIAFFDAMVEEGWSVTCYYDEEGMSYYGIYEDGDDEYAEVDFTNENWRDEVSDRILVEHDLDERYESWLEWNTEEE